MHDKFTRAGMWIVGGLVAAYVVYLYHLGIIIQ
jgi:hypothetical protein